MSGPIKTRRARRGDGDSIASLLRQCGYEDGADANTLLWVFNHPEIEVIVAVESHDKPIGFLSLSHRPQLRLKGRIATIDELIVADSWRKQGVGSLLLAAGVARAKALSAKRIEMTMDKSKQDSSRNFFTKNGFALADSAVVRLAELEK